MGNCMCLQPHQRQSDPRIMNQSQRSRSIRKKDNLIEDFSLERKTNLLQTIEYQMKIKQNKQDLYGIISKIFFSKYSKDELGIIDQLLKHWNQDLPLQVLLNDDLISKEYHRYYKTCEIIAARVFSHIVRWFKGMKAKNIGSQQEDQIKFQNYLNKNGFQLSYDRYFMVKASRTSTKVFCNGYHKNPSKVIKEHHQYLLQLQEKSYFGSNFIQELHTLMKNIGFICDKQKESQNIFVLNLQRIVRQDQQKMYIQDMRIPYLDKLQQYHLNSLKGQVDKSDEREMDKIIKQKNANYWYYSSEGKIGINFLHQKYQNYDFLQDRHDYIQLMFPNHYGSKFNSRASPLNYLEKYIFFESEYIGFKILQSIYIFLDFMGISLNIEQKPIKLQLISIARLTNVLVKYTHNHLRIMRILACLSVVGFRAISLKLIQFLREIVQRKDFKAVRRQFEQSWDIYGNQYSGEKSKIKAKQMCFLQTPEFPKQHAILAKIDSFLKKSSSTILKYHEIFITNNQSQLSKSSQRKKDKNFNEILLQTKNNKPLFQQKNKEINTKSMNIEQKLINIDNNLQQSKRNSIQNLK